ncbi:unnamed protein product, partial [Hapterophycus canaliculatus]
GGASRQSSPPSGGGGSSRATGRRPTGNKALDKKPFDMAAIQSLARAAGTDKPGSGGTGPAGDTSRAGRKRLLGGVRFWAGVEGVVKTALLLLAGAGVGGLLLPEARAAVAQAKFEAKYRREFIDPMSRLEVLPGESDDRDEVAGVGSTTAMDFGREGTGSTVTNEFGEVVDAVDAVDAAAPLSGESKEALSGGEEVHSQGEEDGFVAAAASASASASTEGTERGAGRGLVSEATAWFLNCVDFLVSWAHFLSTVSMPWGAGGHMSCVSAIYLALFVRLAVATAFSALRVVLGLPALPPAASDSKPGMVMGMVLASVPTLGKVL